MPEVSDEQLVVMQRAVDLIQKMEANPESKPLIQKAVKVINPDFQTEEDLATRIAAPHVEKIDALSAQMREFLDAQTAKETAAAEARTTAQIEEAFGRLQGQGYTADGLEKIKSLMVDRSIADPEAAAALFDRLHPKVDAGQPGWAPDHWRMEDAAPEGVDIKELFANEDKWADNEAAKVLNEIRLGKVA